MELKIEIILVWNDIRDFQQHVAAMKSFRQSHRDNPPDLPELPKDAPRPDKIHLADSWEGAKRFIATQAQPTLVPIWEMELPRGVQN
jgi:hypothetical protein